MEEYRERSCLGSIRPVAGFSRPLILKCLAKNKSAFRFEVYENPFEYHTINNEIISVPVGFKTDFASVPWFFRRVIPATGRYNEATVIHDYLCYLSNKLQYNRRKADRIFYEAMADLEVNKLKSLVIYFGVRAYTEILLLYKTVKDFF